MNIAELFVSLGIKGSEKTLGALGNVKKGMGETASMSLEAKAAILGAIYAFQRLMSASGQAGTNLSNFNAAIGMSTKLLQQYQYAARQVGVSNDEMAGTFKTLQSNMSKILLGKGAPEGMARMAELTGAISAEDVEKFMRSPDLLLQKLQEYAAKETNIGLRNEVLKSFGVGDNMIAALSKRAFTPEMLAKAPTYSDSEIKKLTQADAAWANLGNTIEMAFGKFNAKHGVQLVQDITKITESVLELSNALTTLAEKLGAFELLGDIVKGWTGLLKGDITKSVNDILKSEGIEDPTFTDQMRTLFNAMKPEGKAFGGKSLDNNNVIDSKGRFLERPFPKNIVPNSPAIPPQSSNETKTQNFNINQSLNFQHDGKDAKQTGDSMKVAVQQAYRQSFGQAQVT